MAGFLFAAGRHIDFVTFIVTILSISLIIGSGCVYNNYLDRNIDKKMNRTKKRASVTGLISLRAGMIYATVLGALGFILLFRFVNTTTAIIGLIGIVDYVILYGYTKRKGTYGTLVGSISGATPPLAGYTAVTGHIDAAGLLLFLILVFWQMPHFYAIAMFRFRDYAAAKIPVLPVVRGMRTTKLYISVYIFWVIVAMGMLSAYRYIAWPYGLILLLAGLWWLFAALKGFKKNIDDTAWARGIFFKSLIVLLVFCVTISASALL